MYMVPQTSLFLGIIPALIILYISLKDYEGYYKDKNIFLSFVIGIFLGFIAILAKLVIGAPPGILVFIVLFAFSDQLLKTMLLNIGRLQRKKETTIYGLSLGLGFGSIFTPFLIIASSSFLTDGYYYISLIGLGSIGIILFHAATGAYIGYGIYSGKTMKYLIIAIIIQIPFNFIVDMTRGVTSKYFVYFQLGLIVFGLILFWYVFTKIMPQILVKRKKSKKGSKTK